MIKRNEKLGPRFLLEELRAALVSRLLQLERDIGTKNIVDIRISGDVIVPYTVITEDDKHGSLVAAAAQKGSCGSGCHFPDDPADVPNDLFGEIDNADEVDVSEYHVEDATGVPDEPLTFEEDNPLEDDWDPQF